MPLMPLANDNVGGDLLLADSTGRRLVNAAGEILAAPASSNCTCLHRQAKKCSDSSDADLWLPLADLPSTLAIAKSGICYHFNEGNNESCDPGTIAENYLIIPSCADSACSMYYRLRRCVNNALVNIYVRVSGVTSASAIVRISNECYRLVSPPVTEPAGGPPFGPVKHDTLPEVSGCHAPTCCVFPNFLLVNAAGIDIVCARTTQNVAMLHVSGDPNGTYLAPTFRTNGGNLNLHGDVRAEMRHNPGLNTEGNLCDGGSVSEVREILALRITPSQAVIIAIEEEYHSTSSNTAAYFRSFLTSDCPGGTGLGQWRIGVPVLFSPNETSGGLRLGDGGSVTVTAMI